MSNVIFGAAAQSAVPKAYIAIVIKRVRVRPIRSQIRPKRMPPIAQPTSRIDVTMPLYCRVAARASRRTDSQTQQGRHTIRGDVVEKQSIENVEPPAKPCCEQDQPLVSVHVQKGAGRLPPRYQFLWFACVASTLRDGTSQRGSFTPAPSRAVFHLFFTFVITNRLYTRCREAWRYGGHRHHFAAVLCFGQSTLNFPRVMQPRTSAQPGSPCKSRATTRRPLTFTLFGDDGVRSPHRRRHYRRADNSRDWPVSCFPATAPRAGLKLTSTIGGLQGFWFGGDFRRSRTGPKPHAIHGLSCR